MTFQRGDCHRRYHHFVKRTIFVFPSRRDVIEERHVWRVYEIVTQYTRSEGSSRISFFFRLISKWIFMAIDNYK